MASYEEDAPTLVNNLVSEPTPGEEKDMDRIEENKTTEDRRDLIVITDKKNDLDFDYLYYTYTKLKRFIA